MGKAYLLAGEPRTGKTTAITKLIDAVGKEGCGGFYTEEIRVEGLRTGFRLVTLHGGRDLLAHIDLAGSPRHGRYGLNLACLETLAAPAIHEAIKERTIIVIDEIGPIEAYSDRFREAVIAALDSSLPILGTIALHPHPWIDALKHHPNVEIYHLTPHNRDHMVDDLMRYISPRMG